MGNSKSDEIKEIAKQVVGDFMQEDDALDKLINDIISIEKQHRHISSGGKDRKHKQISKLIYDYINSDEDGKSTE